MTQQSRSLHLRSHAPKDTILSVPVDFRVICSEKDDPAKLKAHTSNPLITALRRQRLEDCFKCVVNRLYIARSCTFMAYMERPCLKTTTNKTNGISPHSFIHCLYSWRCHVYLGRVSLCSPTWFWTKKNPPASAYPCTRLTGICCHAQPRKSNPNGCCPYNKRSSQKEVDPPTVH